MWEFFIALFGGLFYGNKYRSEKSTTKTARETSNNLIQTHQNDLDSWESKTTDRQLESELRSLISRATYDEILNALIEIGWSGEMSQNPERYREDVLRLLMSSKGKLPYSDATFGINSHYGKDPESKEEALLNVRSYNIVMFIDAQLKHHGIDEPMYVYRVAYHPLHDKSSHVSGRYMWKPMLPFNPNIIEISPNSRIICGIDEPINNSLSDALNKSVE